MAIDRTTSVTAGKLIDILVDLKIGTVMRSISLAMRKVERRIVK